MELFTFTMYVASAQDGVSCLALQECGEPSSAGRRMRLVTGSWDAAVKVQSVLSFRYKYRVV